MFNYIQNMERGHVELEYANNEKVKLTKRQIGLVVRIVKAHVEDKNFWFSWAKVYVSKYFVALSFYYTPNLEIPGKMGGKNNPYLTVHKEIYIGPRGAFQKFEIGHGVGKMSDYRKIADYHLDAEDLSGLNKPSQRHILAAKYPLVLSR